jgi:prepilin-type N-terminal cleavage/methylation domain-containing protein
MTGSHWRGFGRRSAPGDAGVTLVELVVAMTLMSVFGSMFTVAIVQIYRTTSQAEAIADAQTQVTRAFTRIDREIRYATAVSDPATPGQYAYVEFLITNSGTPHCVQLRVERDTRTTDEYLLRRRGWPQGGTIPAWSSVSVLMTGITVPNPLTAEPFDPAGATPFPPPEADAAIEFQRLRVRLASKAGGSRSQTKDTDITFTALNSSVTSSSNSAVCAEGR